MWRWLLLTLLSSTQATADGFGGGGGGGLPTGEKGQHLVFGATAWEAANDNQEATALRRRATWQVVGLAATTLTPQVGTAPTCSGTAAVSVTTARTFITRATAGSAAGEEAYCRVAQETLSAYAPWNGAVFQTTGTLTNVYHYAGLTRGIPTLAPAVGTTATDTTRAPYVFVAMNATQVLLCSDDRTTGASCVDTGVTASASTTYRVQIDVGFSTAATITARIQRGSDAVVTVTKTTHVPPNDQSASTHYMGWHVGVRTHTAATTATIAMGHIFLEQSL